MDDIEMEAELQHLLTLFDDSGFVPTTLLPDPEEAATEWKTLLVNWVQTMYKKIESLQAKNAELRHTNEAIQRATAQDILQQMWDWKDRGTPFIADIQELADRYGVEVEE